MRRGRGWEVKLETWHNDYRKASRAVVWKTEPGVKAVGGGRVVFTGVGPPDFFGIVEGTPVVFDAKDTATKSVLYTSQVPPHQARDLEAAMSRGGVAFLATRVAGVQRVLLWRDIREAYWAKTKSFDLQVGIKFGDEGWLDVILEEVRRAR